MPRLFEIYDDNIRDWFPEMLRACLGTLKLSLFAFIVAAALGLIVALLQDLVAAEPAVARHQLYRGVRGTADRRHSLHRLFRAAAALP